MDENRLFGVWENALLLSLQLEQTSQEAHQSLEELASLVVSLGARVADRIIQNRPQIHPAYFFGTGKLSQIKEVLHQKCADAVIVDASLTPKQTRNLEQKWKRPVLDRTQVILEIFARNARTREAKLQIELAQAEFLMPRLAGLWKHLDRERGGIGVSRGGGEKQIENDRQYLRRRISKLRDEIKRIEKERNTQKKRRVQCLNVSLVGYTNAGKMEEDFRPKILLSDTVGFIKNLPHELVAAFRSTLSTIRDADLLLHVIDASSDFEDHIQTTHQVLSQMDADCIPVLKVFNKIDQVPQAQLQILRKLNPDSVFISALNEGVEELRESIGSFFEKRMETMTIRLDYQQSQNISDIYQYSRVDSIDYQEEGILMTLTSLPGNLSRLRHHLTPSKQEVMS